MASPQSIAETIASPFIWVRKRIYQDFYLRKLEKLNELMGGRPQSGLVGSRARFIRIGINVLCISIILASIFMDGGMTASAFSTFWSSGAVLQPWAGAALLGCMGANMIAVLFGTAANFSKIQQYTHLELTLEELINDKKQKNGKARLTRLPMPLQKRVMLFIRYLHDLNGIAGSAISVLLFMGCAMGFMFPSVYVMPLTLCAILFCTSRASSLISVLFAPLTNQLRLHYYKGRTNDQIAQYYAEHAQELNNQQGIINQYLNAIFNEELIAKIPKHHDLIRFACYRAFERHSLNDEVNQDLVQRLRTMLTQHFQHRKGCDHEDTCIPISAVEDNYMITEMVDALIINKKDADSSSLRFIERHPDHLLELTLKNEVNSGKVINEATKKLYLTVNPQGRHVINTKVAMNNIPLESNSHGTEFVPGHHCAKIAQLLVSPA